MEDYTGHESRNLPPSVALRFVFRQATARISEKAGSHYNPPRKVGYIPFKELETPIPFMLKGSDKIIPHDIICGNDNVPRFSFDLLQDGSPFLFEEDLINTAMVSDQGWYSLICLPETDPFIANENWFAIKSLHEQAEIDAYLLKTQDGTSMPPLHYLSEDEAQQFIDLFNRPLLDELIDFEFLASLNI